MDALGLEAGSTDLAGVVGDHERADDEVAGLDGLHLAADFFDDTDVLVPHHLVVDRNDPAVRPQVRPADAGRAEPEYGVGGFDDPRVLAFLNPNIARLV